MAFPYANQIRRKVSNSSIGQKVSSALTSLAIGILEAQYYLAAKPNMNLLKEDSNGNVRVIDRAYENVRMFPWPSREIKEGARSRTLETLEGMDAVMYHVMDKPYVGIPVALAVNILPTLAVYWAAGRLSGKKKLDYENLQDNVHKSKELSLLEQKLA
jgi:hypothetical protein